MFLYGQVLIILANFISCNDESGKCVISRGFPYCGAKTAGFINFSKRGKPSV